ncbi:MAG TPA: hypothetical protein VGD56_00520 [Gemmatirosa sp.]
MTRLLARPSLVLACAVAAPLAVTPFAAHAQNATPTTASTTAAKPPNMSGTWELNVAKSTFGPQGAPTKATMTLTQVGDKITTTQAMESAMGNATNTMHHTIGVATTDTVNGGGQQMPFTSTARWDGTTLVVEGKATMQGTDIPVVSRYTLSPDGKQLVVDQVVTTPMGELPSHFVYDKKS